MAYAFTIPGWPESIRLFQHDDGRISYEDKATGERGFFNERQARGIREGLNQRYPRNIPDQRPKLPGPTQPLEGEIVRDVAHPRQTAVGPRTYQTFEGTFAEADPNAKQQIRGYRSIKHAPKGNTLAEIGKVIGSRTSGNSSPGSSAGTVVAKGLARRVPWLGPVLMGADAISAGWNAFNPSEDNDIAFTPHLLAQAGKAIWDASKDLRILPGYFDDPEKVEKQHYSYSRPSEPPVTEPEVVEPTIVKPARVSPPASRRRTKPVTKTKPVTPTLDSTMAPKATPAATPEQVIPQEVVTQRPSLGPTWLSPNEQIQRGYLINPMEVPSSPVRVSATPETYYYNATGGSPYYGDPMLRRR